MKSDIKKLQNEILNIYKEFKRICDENNLKYYAIGGTCIGAIRHKGFIPWDDDLDVAMPFEDYEKFRKIAPKELNNNYNLIDYIDCNRTYKFHFMKIENLNTTFVEQGELYDYNQYKGVYIDIMPISAISKNIILRCTDKIRFYFYDKLNKNIRLKYEEKKSLKGKILWILSRPLFILKKKNYYSKKFDKLCRKREISSKKYILFPFRIPLRRPYSNIFDFEDFKDSLEVPFEDTSIKLPIGYDNYLKKDFGDYMQLPPEEKRISHLPAILDLNTSYVKYMNEKKEENS